MPPAHPSPHFPHQHHHQQQQQQQQQPPLPPPPRGSLPFQPPPNVPPPPPPSSKVSAIHKGADALLALMLDEQSKAIAKVEEHYQRQFQEVMASWRKCENHLIAANNALETNQQRHNREKTNLENRIKALEQTIQADAGRPGASAEQSELEKVLEETDITWDGRSLVFGQSWGDGHALSAAELRSFLKLAHAQAKRTNDTEARLARLEASLGFGQPSSHPPPPPPSQVASSSQIPQKREPISEEEATTEPKRMKFDDAAQSMPSPVASPRVVPKIVSPSSKPLIDTALTPKLSQPKFEASPEPASTFTAMDVDQGPSTPTATPSHPHSIPTVNPGQSSPGVTIVQRGPKSKIPMPGVARRTS